MQNEIWGYGVSWEKQKYYILFTVNKMQHYIRKWDTLHEYMRDMKQNTEYITE
jgi:hypothetical protein